MRTAEPDVENTADQLAQQRVELAAILGMEEAVAPEVLERAVEDPDYAHDLLVCRRDPKMLQLVLNKAARRNGKPNGDDANLGAAYLVKAAAKSLTVWAKTGFSTVDDEQYCRRLEACATCEFLRSVPTKNSMLYRMAGVQINEDAICGKCGCAIKLKARRTSEGCPQPDDDNPQVSRWNEPLAQEA